MSITPSRITPAEICRLSDEVAAVPRHDYYLHQSTLLAKAWCALRHIPLLVGLGHAFEHLWSRPDNRLETVGEYALVCHICWRVEDAGPFVGFLPNIIYGSSRSMGRELPLRRCDSVMVELARLESGVTPEQESR